MSEEEKVNVEVNEVVKKPKKKLVLAKNRAQAIWAVVIFGSFILFTIYNIFKYFILK